VALLLARYPDEGTRLALVVGVGFAVTAAVLSSLRLSPVGSRGAEAVRVRDGQRAKGE
jgi:DHA2 family multidrug resistance protein-like MFS transporter